MYNNAVNGNVSSTSIPATDRNIYIYKNSKACMYTWASKNARVFTTTCVYYVRIYCYGFDGHDV